MGVHMVKLFTLKLLEDIAVGKILDKRNRNADNNSTSKRHYRGFNIADKVTRHPPSQPS